jgi:hypothetical protein
VIRHDYVRLAIAVYVCDRHKIGNKSARAIAHRRLERPVAIA